MYLNFNADNCKNCYKCLRDCPVKAITVIDERARIDERLAFCAATASMPAASTRKRWKARSRR